MTAPSLFGSLTRCACVAIVLLLPIVGCQSLKNARDWVTSNSGRTITLTELIDEINFAVVAYQKREADQREQERARLEAERRSQDLTVAEKNIVDQGEAKLAVSVGETADSQLVMIVDENNKPVNNQVYEVKNSEISTLPSLAQAQERQPGQEVLSSKPATAEPVPTTSPGTTPAPATPLPETVDPNDVRFGKIGSEKVIFRL